MPSAHPEVRNDSIPSLFHTLLRWGLLWLGGMVISMSTSYAQLSRNCGTMGHLEELMKSHPSMRINMKAIENQRLRVAKGSSLGVTGRINIPVVVHVVYHTEVQNISDDQIRSQIEVLNQDFQRKNPDRFETPTAFQAVASSPNLHFHLAKRDPNGLATTGITRTYSPKTVFYTNQNDVKRNSTNGTDAWPADQYLNIWVCPLANGVLGYAQFPGGPVETDGVVINYKAFGTIGTVTAPFDKGRTTTHEVGHWLNLKHIWGDRYGMCDEDDEVGDTPPTSNPHYGCSHEAHSCGTHDMPSNFMDYTDDACMNLFTFGQSERMRPCLRLVVFALLCYAPQHYNPSRRTIFLP